MAKCPRCMEDVADNAAICRHCKATIGTLARPTGITIMAAILLIGSAYSLFIQFSSNWSYSMIMGLVFPLNLARLITLIDIGLGIFCGIGFLRLTTASYITFLWLAVFRIANNLISTTVTLKSIHQYYSYVPSSYNTSIIIGIVVGVGITLWMLYYVTRRKDYFIN